ncbi:MAG: hypothetical protein DM484_21100 [Candidatus Methylumidiphilus alinenensis]|uniref:Uncharacterized protein n=1 Tax=Candidatus Methylumidiphilus alinenensis TaxID=2202197 RepID=A0A2W4QQP6_9GAMM|nr:MAG: hypothetical protein DM484_21100 [Candidatus Methylumidiphilus alinenensis]
MPESSVQGRQPPGLTFTRKIVLDTRHSGRDAGIQRPRTATSRFDVRPKNSVGYPSFRQGCRNPASKDGNLPVYVRPKNSVGYPSFRHPCRNDGFFLVFNTFMQLRFFTIPIYGGGDTADELNLNRPPSRCRFAVAKTQRPPVC